MMLVGCSKFNLISQDPKLSPALVWLTIPELVDISVSLSGEVNGWMWFRLQNIFNISGTMRLILQPHARIDYIRAVLSWSPAAAQTSPSVLFGEPARSHRGYAESKLLGNLTRNIMPKDYLTEYEPLLSKGSKPKGLQVSR